MEEKQTKLKTNAADNADITQSQARDTRHRRMLEVNSLCTDGAPLWANTVLCYSKVTAGRGESIVEVRPAFTF